MIVTTPSGLTVQIRKLKGREANTLANKRLARKGEVFDTVLDAITENVESTGPYPGMQGSKSVAWDRVLVCDRFYTLVSARVATYGPEYIFPVQCQGNHGCDNRFEWELDLENDVPVFDLPEESRAKIANGENRFDAECDGRHVVFSLLDGRKERKMGRGVADIRHELVTRSIAARILSVEGIPGKGQVFRDAVNMWLSDEVDLLEQGKLLSAMEAVDGGFETSLEIQCPACERIFDYDIPFEGAPFWMPRSKKRSSERRATRMMSGKKVDHGEIAEAAEMARDLMKTEPGAEE